jgi:C4-dicarboxylate transporter, DctM subunit
MVGEQVTLRDILSGVLPSVAVLAVGIVILAIFPGLVTWLPDRILG